MSRFANPAATGRLTLGPCECPGTPHAEDWIELRTELSGDETHQFLAFDSADAMQFLVVRWNLLDEDGDPAPVDREHISRLFSDTFEKINDWTKENIRIAPVPNRSGAPSRNTSRGSASSTRHRK